MKKTPGKELFSDVPCMGEIVRLNNEELRQKLLSREDMTSRQIDIGEIPAQDPNAYGSPEYPYAEWAKIRPGKAVEITLLLRHRHPRGVRTTLERYFQRHNMGLRVVQRQERDRPRMWVARPREEEKQL